MTPVRVVLVMTLSMSKPSKPPILIASFMSLQTELCRALFYCAILRSHSENCLPQAFSVFSNIFYLNLTSNSPLLYTMHYILHPPAAPAPLLLLLLTLPLLSPFYCFSSRSDWYRMYSALVFYMSTSLFFASQKLFGSSPPVAANPP